MPHRARNIYRSIYSIMLVVAVCFFAHNIFEPVNYDVLHIEETYYVGETAFHIHDIFPFYDAPAQGYYGEVPRMDIQTYIFRLSNKLIMLALALGMYRLMAALNIFLRELPGRRFVQMPYILLVFVLLFAYEALDFIFRAAQTNWMYEALATAVALVTIAVIKRNKDA